MITITKYSLALTVAGTLFLTSAPVHASQETDDRIVATAEKSHVYKTYLKDDSIHTVAKDGAVTLTGTVAETYHKALAEYTVSGLPGVTTVDNQLKVVGEPADKRSDSWIKRQVQATLMFHRNVSAAATTVTVLDGHVTLQGEAASQAQKELTTEYAGDIENVEKVHNKMTVSSNPETPSQTLGEQIDDASITAQVMASLMTHRSTSALHTSVSTRDGVVTLGGIAKNDAERSLVSKLVHDINGVTGVENNMTINEPLAAK